MVDLRVDTDGLGSAGGGLLSTAGAAGVAPRCYPAASDPVSVSVAETLTQWSHVLWTLMEHAGQQRAAGGLSVTRTADYLDAVDEAGAARIVSATDGEGSAVPESLAPTAAVPAPILSPIAQMPAPPPLTGEQVSAMVHCDPQPDRLRAFAYQWRNQVAPHILATADHTRRCGSSIQRSWDDGDPQAAANVVEHADWLESSLHTSALGLADAADQAADYAEAVIQNTPAPQEFHDIRRRLNAALAYYHASGDPSQAIALTNQLGQKQGVAVAGYQSYAAAAPVTTAGAAQPPAPAPPIVRGAGPAATIDRKANQLNPGAHHGNSGNGDEPGQGTGRDTLQPSTADFGPPLGPSGNPPVAPAADPTVTGTAANIAGTVMGVGVGTVGQLANSLHGMSGGGSPLSALSGLSSLPGLGGMPHTGGSQMPSGPGDGSGGAVPDLGNDHDFGSGGTTPSGSGVGDVSAPMVSSTPAVSGAPSAASLTASTPAISTPAAGALAAGGGPGMVVPPMMGGPGRGNDENRKSNDKRRVVMRPVVNSELVFGEVERKPRRGAARKEDS